MEFLNEPKAADHHQGERALARAPARAHGLHRRQALRRRRPADRRIPHRRPVHLDGLYALDALDPVSAAQGRRADAPLRLRSGQPFRQGVRGRAGELFARRAVPDRRGHALPVRARDHASRRAPARARAGAARPLRPLRLDHGVRAARALRLLGAHRDRHLSGRAPTRAGSRRSIRSFPKGRWCACTSSSRAIGGETPNPDRATLEQAVEQLVRTWTDGLAEALTLVHEPIKAQQLTRRYREAFPVGYREAYVPPVAVADIRLIESLSPIRPLGADFYARREGDRACAGLKVWSREKPIPLSERVPVLENMGFRVVDERTYRIEPGDAGAAEVWLHDMMLERADGAAFDHRGAEGAARGRFMAVMRGRAENDGYNALVLTAGLQWRDVALVRTISRYPAPGARAVFAGLHVGDAAQAFRHRGADRGSCSTSASIRASRSRWKSAPSSRPRSSPRSRRRSARCESLDEDRILRHFVNAVTSALRTNFYQLGDGGQPKPTIAIKFDSRKIDGLPLPKPLYEIFVYSPRVEGVHLRFGKVARGGIRWSDRPQDFRTEVLGLVKAQQVKNAVIVPVGAKGGFVPKQLPAGPREAVQAEGTAAYKVFISSLLDITDNLGPDGVIHPENVVRHDDDDPYLVVAADKGTATFSDTANGISLEHGFWLGDAFASGGSAGYDHKKMGITARGRLGGGEAPLPRDGRRHRDDAVHGRGRRRHVGRRVRQRHAARAHHQAGRGVRSSRHLHRSESRSGAQLRPSASACSISRARAGRTTTRTIISAGGGIYPRKAKEIALSDEAARAARPRRREIHAAAGDDRDPEAERRSAVVRRHRHLYPRHQRDRRSGRRPRQRSDPHHRRGAALQGGGRGRQSRHDADAAASRRRSAASGSTPTRSTIRPASTPPTSRSTSRSRSRLPVRDGRLTDRGAQRAARRDDRRGRRGWCCATIISRRWRSRWRSGAGWRTSASSSA